MKYIVDRFEEDFAVCETKQGEYINIERSRLPEDIKEGDIVIQEAGLFYIDLDETEKRNERVKKLAEDLWI